MLKTRKHFPRPRWKKSKPADADQNEAWIREKGGAIHPAFATPAQYNADEKRFVTDEELATQ
jgi:hypothetical protein